MPQCITANTFGDDASSTSQNALCPYKGGVKPVQNPVVPLTQLSVLRLF